MGKEIQGIDITDLSRNTFLQTSTWAIIKSEFSWNAYAFRQEKFPLLSSDILLLVRHIPFFGSLGYIPNGILSSKQVDLAEETESLLQAKALIAELHEEILSLPNCKKVLSIRWDTPWLWEATAKEIEDGSILKRKLDSIKSMRTDANNIHRSKMTHSDSTQPPATVIIDLQKSIDDILSNMKSKTRYNTRLAEKKGVVITDEISVDEFYEIYERTSSRNNISIHSRDYYQCVYEQCRQSQNIDVFIYGARVEDELIAAIFVVHNFINEQEKEAIYLYGASSNAYRNFMPAYALQLHAIKDAKMRHCSRYDMFGIPLSADPTHRMHGLYRFKTGFGGCILFRLGSIEISSLRYKGAKTRNLRHRIFVLVEKFRLWYYYNYKK